MYFNIQRLITSKIHLNEVFIWIASNKFDTSTIFTCELWNKSIFMHIKKMLLLQTIWKITALQQIQDSFFFLLRQTHRSSYENFGSYWDWYKPFQFFFSHVFFPLSLFSFFNSDALRYHTAVLKASGFRLQHFETEQA